MNNKVILKVSAVILGWASIFHFANFLLGGVIVIMGYTVPVYFSFNMLSIHLVHVNPSYTKEKQYNNVQRNSIIQSHFIAHRKP